MVTLAAPFVAGSACPHCKQTTVDCGQHAFTIVEGVQVPTGPRGIHCNSCGCCFTEDGTMRPGHQACDLGAQENLSVDITSLQQKARDLQAATIRIGSLERAILKQEEAVTVANELAAEAREKIAEVGSMEDRIKELEAQLNDKDFLRNRFNELKAEAPAPGASSTPAEES